MNLPISSMTTAEKVAAMEALWASLQQAADPPPAPDWHGQVLSRRREQIERGETTFLSLEEVRTNIERRSE